MGSACIDDIAGLIQGGSRFTVHADGVGSTMAVFDGRQELVSRYEYSSFGQVKKITEKVVLPFLYTGARNDAESGFHYLRTRAYDPAIGRFVSPDVIGIAGDVNLYRYVNNNPVNYIDPSGELAFTVVCTVTSMAWGGIRAVTEGKYPGTREFGAAIYGSAVSGFIPGLFIDLAILSGMIVTGAAATATTLTLTTGGFILVLGTAVAASFLGTWLEKVLENRSKGMSWEEASAKYDTKDLVASAATTLVATVFVGGKEIAKPVVGGVFGGFWNLAKSNLPSDVIDEVVSTVVTTDWSTERKGADYLKRAKELIIASKAFLSNANRYAGVIDSLAAAANNAFTQAQKAQGAVSSAKASVNSARSACLNAPPIGEIKAAHDVVVKAAAETQSLKERAIKASVRACSVADQRNREKDALAKTKLDMEAKNLAIHAERNFGQPAQKAYMRAKENADKVLALEQKRAEATGKAEAARSALNNAQIEVDVAVKMVRNADDGIRAKGLPTLNLEGSAIQSGINSKNAALNLLAKFNTEIIPNLETGEKREMLDQQTTLIAEATKITIPLFETIESKFNQVNGTLKQAKAAADQASSALSKLKEALKPCEEVEPVAEIVREAMGAADAAHRSLQITNNVISKAQECAKLPQTAGKQESAKAGTGSTGQPPVTGGLPPAGADPFVGTWALRVTPFKHSNPDAPKVGGLTERGRMVINRFGNKYSVTGMPGKVDSVSVSGETITIKGRQAEGDGRYDLFTVQLTLKYGGSRLEGQMRIEYTSELRPSGVPVQYSISLVVGTRQ